MKRNILITFILLLHFCAGAQNRNVGIDTDEPSRNLDVNGNLKVNALPDVSSTGSNYPRILTADQDTGNVDNITTSSFMQSSVNNVEVKRNVYLAPAADSSKECKCGDIAFRINSSNFAELRLNNNSIFNKLNTNAFEIDYGIKRWTEDYYNYFNDTVMFDTNNYSIYQNLDPEAFASNNTIRIYTIILPKQNNLYRLTLTRLANSPTNSAFSLICEKFYIQTL